MLQVIRFKCLLVIKTKFNLYITKGVLNETIDFYQIDDSLAGLIQTIFYLGFIMSAPLFGYLGDRYKRKWIITFGVSFWSLMTLVGSFIPSNVCNIYLFLLYLYKFFF